MAIAAPCESAAVLSALRSSVVTANPQEDLSQPTVWQCLPRISSLIPMLLAIGHHDLQLDRIWLDGFLPAVKRATVQDGHARIEIDRSRTAHASIFPHMTAVLAS
jgi:hypothetical protein